MKTLINLTVFDLTFENQLLLCFVSKFSKRLNRTNNLPLLNETNCLQTSTGNTLVSLDKFSGAGLYDMEWNVDLLGQRCV